MQFDYNFTKCPICESDMTHSLIRRCDNGCCAYQLDPQGEIVRATLFQNEAFVLELYQNALLQWQPVTSEDTKKQEKLNKQMNRFLERVDFWKDQTTNHSKEEFEG